ADRGEERHRRAQERGDPARRLLERAERGAHLALAHGGILDPEARSDAARRPGGPLPMLPAIGADEPADAREVVVEQPTLCDGAAALSTSGEERERRDDQDESTGVHGRTLPTSRTVRKFRERCAGTQNRAIAPVSLELRAPPVCNSR